MNSSTSTAEVKDHSIDTSRIQNYGYIEQMASSLLCLICRSIPLHPLQCLGCNSICCKECFEEWNQPKNCPQRCASPKYNQPLILAKKLFSELKVSCINQAHGCIKVVSFDSLENHEKECEFQKKKCPKYRHCRKQLLVKDIRAHIQECEFIEVECEHCEEEIPRKDLEDHIENECPYYSVECRHCGKELQRRRLPRHEKECDEKEIRCKKCKLKMKRSEEDDHDCIEYLVGLIMDMKRESKETKEVLQEFKVELQVVKEEFQGTKEELQESKGELQGTKEELQEIKEELQKVKNDIKFVNELHY